MSQQLNYLWLLVAVGVAVAQVADTAAAVAAAVVLFQEL
jgi:hypothetical protein